MNGTTHWTPLQGPGLCWRCDDRPATADDGLCDSCFDGMEVGQAYAEHPDEWAELLTSEPELRLGLVALGRFALGQRATNPAPLPRWLEG